MKRLYTLLLFIAFGLQAFAQVPANTPQVVLRENFIDNRNGWKEYRNEKAEVFVNAGSLVFEHKRREGGWSTTVPVPLNVDYDFEIVSTITKLYGVNNHGYGLVWGARNSENAYVFLVSGDGFFQLGKAYGGKYYPIIKWQASTAINKWNGTNTFRISKQNTSLTFHLNGKSLATIPFQEFYGDRVGFFVNRNMRLKVHNLLVASSTTAPSDINPESYPPDLFIEKLTFSETTGDSALQGDESGFIRFDLVNRGRGRAENMQVKLTPLNLADGLIFSPSTTISKIESKSYRSIEIPIKAEYNLPAGERKLRVDVSEGSGFDADPVILTFHTVELLKADLKIQQVAIDDNEDKPGQGDSYGNGNSVIEPGESIEVTAFVQNHGQGLAPQVKAKILVNTDDINITFPDKDKEYLLGDIEAGDYRKLEFYFYTSRRYTTDKIPFTVQLTDSRGVSSLVDLGLRLGIRTPNIVDVNVNKLVIDPEDKGLKRIDEIIVPSDVDLDIPVTGKDGSNTLAVIIGVENYKYAPRVDYAAHDAQIFYQYARNTLGIPERNIFYRVDDGATSGEFTKLLADDGWLARRIAPGETDIIFYYAGHGAPDTKDKGAYLIPYDIDPNYANTGVLLDDLYMSLSNLPARDVTVFLDACFSGVSRSNEMLIAGARGVIIKPKKPEILGDNVVVMAASTDEQYSSSFPDKYHGLFTYFLLKGIRGEAFGGDNILSLAELYSYVSTQVSREAGFLDKQQTPTLEGKEPGRVFFDMR